MKRTFKRTFAALITATTMAVGMGGMGANAVSSDTWRATGRNIPGAPTSTTMESDSLAVYHGSNGAIAQTTGVIHTIPGSSATSIIDCKNFAMTTVRIYDYDTIEHQLSPNIGEPLANIRVEYAVGVITDTVSDTATTTGVIRENT